MSFELCFTDGPIMVRDCVLAGYDDHVKCRTRSNKRFICHYFLKSSILFFLWKPAVCTQIRPYGENILSGSTWF